MNSATSNKTSRWLLLGELGMILVLFFVVAGLPVPNVNESHYLARLKHFWNPSWCTGDLFLHSREAHPVFCWTFGWITRFVDLPASAWIGRLGGWTLLAAGWLKLSRSVIGDAARAVGWSLFSAGVAVALWQHAHVAGEWIVGGIEAKIPAYAFVFFGLAQLVKGNWGFALPLFGAATAFHPLVGGWALVVSIAAFTLDRERPNIASLIPAAVLALILAMPGIVPALRLDSGIDAESIKYARLTYVYQRLGHHLLLQRISPVLIARHLLLIGGWAWLWRKTIGKLKGQVACTRLQRLNGFVLGCVGLAVMGVAIELITIRNPFISSTWMRYYWYRMTDSMVPIGFALSLNLWILTPNEPDEPNKPKGTTDRNVRRPARLPTGAEGATMAIALLLVLASVSVTFWRNAKDRRSPADRQGRVAGRTLEEQRQDDIDWKATCEWCAANTNPNDLFLTPVFNQTFKWYTGRPEFAIWKDIPQDSQSIMEWRRRRKEVGLLGLYRIREKPTTDEIVTWANQNDIAYVIIDRHYGDLVWKVPIVHANESYFVYKMPTGRMP